MKMFWISLWWSLHNLTNTLKTTELYILLKGKCSDMCIYLNLEKKKCVYRTVL